MTNLALWITTYYPKAGQKVEKILAKQDTRQDSNIYIK